MALFIPTKSALHLHTKRIYIFLRRHGFYCHYIYKLLEQRAAIIDKQIDKAVYYIMHNNNNNFM